MEKAKQLMRSGDVRGAAERLKTILAARPDDAEALMLFGTCCHLLGDDETFKRIHDKLAPKMAAVADGETQGLWRKYHKLWTGLIVSGLALAGGVVAIAYFGRTVVGECNVAATALAGYRGPGYQRLRKSDSHRDGVSKWEVAREADVRVNTRNLYVTPGCMKGGQKQTNERSEAE